MNEEKKGFCMECGEQFKAVGGLHLHLAKKHKMDQKTYYHKFYPKFDMYNRKLIRYIDYSHYEAARFDSFKNYMKFLINTKQDEKCRKLIIDSHKVEIARKGLTIFPLDTYCHFAKIPNIFMVRRHFESVEEFMKIVGYQSYFDGAKPSKLFCAKSPVPEILVDTREQKPLSFYGAKNVNHKLDIGDYTAAGSYFTKVFVDRKAKSDFISTFGMGFNRFKREAQRAVDFNSYLVVVVEESWGDCYKHMKKSKYGNTSYVIHNVKEILRDFPNNVQIAFVNGRHEMSMLTQSLVSFKMEDVAAMDIQRYVSAEKAAEINNKKKRKR